LDSNGQLETRRTHWNMLSLGSQKTTGQKLKIYTKRHFFWDGQLELNAAEHGVEPFMVDVCQVAENCTKRQTIFFFLRHVTLFAQRKTGMQSKNNYFLLHECQDSRLQKKHHSMMTLDELVGNYYALMADAIKLLIILPQH
jgi:hypothetical protein